MTRMISHARGALFAACLFTGGLMGGAMTALPAQAQWIGTPGGSGDGAAVAPSDAPAPSAAPAPSTTPAPSPAMAPSSSLPSPDMSQQLPSGFAPGGFSTAPAAPAGPNEADMADCQSQVTKLRGDLESRNETLRKAAERKATPSEICPLFRGFATAQQKFFNYLSTNKTKCGVPDEALKGLKQNSAQVASIRDKVCKAAQLQESGGGGGGGPPPQGAVAAGLGLSSGLPNTDGGKGGVFDTLGGSALR
ncbi:hypothetical protein ACO2RV_04070 [Ancylobacter sp. VNQ12]|uniref:hypothetical protein n=1 Tax=Ancylobacter sp. VNQ12 TaxID=3400920 RepID=UPI003C032827